MAKEQNQKLAHCPNCNQPALRQGNEIICELCDAVFKITKTDGARVKKTGAIEEIHSRLDKVEKELFKTESDEPEPEPENPGLELDEPEPDDTW